MSEDVLVRILEDTEIMEQQAGVLYDEDEIDEHAFKKLMVLHQKVLQKIAELREFHRATCAQWSDICETAFALKKTPAVEAGVSRTALHLSKVQDDSV